MPSPQPERAARRVSAAALLVALVLLAPVAGCSRGEVFPVADYLSKPANLNGNRYVLEAEVDSQLGSKEGVGRVIAVRSAKEKSRIALVIPETLDANLVPTQRYRFEVAVRQGGLIYVSKLEKI
jgi:hypothetical protein